MSISDYFSTIEARRKRVEDPHRLGHKGHGRPPVKGAGHGETGPATKRIIVAYGFWIFLISDIIMFSCFFAAHAVLQSATAGGPTGPELFKGPRVAWETAALLASSFTCGLSYVYTHAKNQLGTQFWLLVTGLLGLIFVLLEAQEFALMAAEGATPQRSAYLSSFFALVGCHGVHVSVGLLWLGTMMAQVYVKGFKPMIMHRLICFNLFWHALDIIWVAIFTNVYLLGARG
jgi:cytochrome o ubiquinol oxidase subunit 3